MKKAYLTLTKGINKSAVHMDMLQVCLKSIKENTSLQINILYDGDKDDEACKIFDEYGANVIFCKCSFIDKLQNYYGENNSKDLHSGLDRMLGCFMKFDISLYEKEEEVVLYTDIDTLYLQDIPEEEFNVRTLKVAPEFNKNYDIIKGYRYFSAGIMLINVKELEKRRANLFEMLDKKIEPYQECWDQGFFNELYKDDFEEWGLEYNWKPYWGINEDATIVHIHGLKLGSMTKRDYDWLKGILNYYQGSYEGWIYYTLKAYRCLGIDKDRFMANYARFLSSAYESSLLNSNKLKFTSVFLSKIEKFTKNKKMFSKLNNYATRKLIKRNIMPNDGNKKLFDEQECWKCI